jgi:hypothetical protein
MNLYCILHANKGDFWLKMLDEMAYLRRRLNPPPSLIGNLPVVTLSPPFPKMFCALSFPRQKKLSNDWERV